MNARLLLLAAVMVAGALVLASAAAGRRARRLPRHRARHLRIRLHLRLRPGPGHATLFELWLRWGRFAAFRKSARARRSLSWWQRALHPGEHSVRLGRAHWFHRLLLPVEEHAVIIAPPRSHKTAVLASVVLRYRGPAVSTTTKADMFAYTSGVRQRRGRVHVFNPQQIGGVPSTFRWNPVHGCQAPAVAIRRADAITGAVSTEGMEDGDFWADKAGSHMRSLFHAAALAGGDMRLVTRWALGDTVEAEATLIAHGAGEWAAELAELRSEAQKTAATIRMVMSRALAFMHDPDLAAAVLPADGAGLDIDRFLLGRGTLYMMADVGGAGDSPLAPLFVTLANEIHWRAAQLGSQMAGGRLDPPLLMALDEIVQVCPVPLPVWAADSGGKGIQIISVAHGEAQLASRWKEHGKQVILDTAGCKLFLPGVTDTSTLDMASRLCGQAPYRERGQEHDTRHDVMAPDMIRRLPPVFALIIRAGNAPVIGRLPRVWRDRLYRRARRLGYATAALTPAEPPLTAEPGAITGDLARFRPVLVPDLDAEAADGLLPGDGQPGGGGAYPWGGDAS